MEERLYDPDFIARPATPEDEIKKSSPPRGMPSPKRAARLEKTEPLGQRASWSYKVAKHREGILRLPAGCARITASWFTSSNGGSACWTRLIKYQTIGLGRRIEAPEEALAQARAARRPPSCAA